MAEQNAVTKCLRAKYFVKQFHVFFLQFGLKNIPLKNRHTVDGRNPTPPGTCKTLQIMGYLPYQLVQDFVHQQYHMETSHLFFWGKSLRDG